jgi:hypothetical protein
MTNKPKFDKTNTIVLNIDGEKYSAKVNVHGREFECILQRQKSKVGTHYIFWKDGDDSLYLFTNSESENENSPQLTGNLQYKSTEYKVALWHKKGISQKTGKPYDFYSGKVQLPQPKAEVKDDLPF